MKKFLFIIITLAIVSCRPADGYLPRTSEPLDSATAAAFQQVFNDVNGLSCCDLHSLMVVQDGQVIYEQYSPDIQPQYLHICWSATKTFTAIAVGFAIQDGLLAVDTPLIHYLPSELLGDSLDDRWQKLTLHHVLSLSSGLRPDSTTDRIRAGESFDPLQEIIERGFQDEPGRRWRYNNADSYLAAMAVEYACGMPLDLYLQKKMFSPMGIRRFYWEKDAYGRCPGGFGLHLTTESLAKMGLLLLQHGQWEGVQLLDSAWVDAMTSIQIYQDQGRSEGKSDEEIMAGRTTDWYCGYCYQMWACKQPGCTRADGMWGQYVIIMPDKNAVGVMTSICTDRTAQMDAFWRNVYLRMSGRRAN